MAEKYVRFNSSAFIAIVEMQIRTAFGFHPALVRMAKVKNKMKIKNKRRQLA